MGPDINAKSGLLACTLFTLSSGFGWIYLLSSSEIQHIISQHSSLEILRTMGHLDIVSTSNFVIPTAPDSVRPGITSHCLQVRPNGND